MKNRDAEVPVGVDIGVVNDRTLEPKGGRGIRVLIREGHLSLKVATVEDTIGVDNHQGELPAEDVVGIDINPLFFLKALQLRHEALLCASPGSRHDEAKVVEERQILAASNEMYEKR